MLVGNPVHAEEGPASLRHPGPRCLERADIDTGHVLTTEEKPAVKRPVSDYPGCTITRRKDGERAGCSRSVRKLLTVCERNRTGGKRDYPGYEIGQLTCAGTDQCRRSRESRGPIRFACISRVLYALLLAARLPTYTTVPTTPSPAALIRLTFGPSSQSAAPRNEPAVTMVSRIR